MRSIRQTGARGAALLEAMVSLSILLVGLLGMMQLQVFGISSNQGARAHTRAMMIARDLASALQQLPSNSSLLTGPTGSLTAPTPFGSLLSGQTITTGGTIHTWAELPTSFNALPESVIERDPASPGDPLYQRRWTVWNYATSGTFSAVAVVAVSVIYHETRLQGLKEVVVYGDVVNQAGILANVLARQ
jgi:hypothetical protein